MRVVVQRVREASVRTEQGVSGRIDVGLLVLVGCDPADGPEDLEWLSRKVVELRVFDDGDGVMNRSVRDLGGGILLVSQFTLLASTRKGTRPSWHRAAPPDVAKPLYEAFHRILELLLGKPVPQGVFGAHMEISLVNEGPVTLVIDSRLRE